MEEQEVPVNIRLAARLVAGAICRIKSLQSAPLKEDAPQPLEQDKNNIDGLAGNDILSGVFLILEFLCRNWNFAISMQ